MNETNLSPDVMEAKNMVANIVKSIGEIDEWLHNGAEEEINRLVDKWGKLCTKTESAKSRKFCAECEGILQKCVSFQNEITAKSESFTNSTEIDIMDIRDKAGDNEAIKILLSHAIDELWNKADHPRLLFLYDKSVELETGIRDMVENAMSA